MLILLFTRSLKAVYPSTVYKVVAGVGPALEIQLLLKLCILRAWGNIRLNRKRSFPALLFLCAETKPLPIRLQHPLSHSQGAGTGFLCQQTSAKFSRMLNFAFRRSWSPQAQVSLQTSEHPKISCHLQPPWGCFAVGCSHSSGEAHRLFTAALEHKETGGKGENE